VLGLLAFAVAGFEAARFAVAVGTDLSPRS
jgi:hypothetical protein